MEFLNIKKYKDTYNFEIKGDPNKGLDKSIINGIRRTLLSNINSVGIPDVIIDKNNTSIHNEFIKQRVSLIPLFLDPTEYKNDYIFILDVSNDGESIKKITTNDFNIFPIINENKCKEELTKADFDLTKPLSEKLKKKIFKPFIIDDLENYILITELKNTNSDTETQSLMLHAIPSVGVAQSHPLFSHLSCITYSFHKDNNIFKKTLQNEIKINKIPPKEQKEFSKDYELANSERYYHRDIFNEPYWYDFTIESYHYHKPIELFKQAINYIILKLIECKDNLQILISNPDNSDFSVESYNEKSFKFILYNYNDTIGNIIQSYISKYITSESFIQFIGYTKPHPLEENIVLIVHPKTNYENKMQTINFIIDYINSDIDKIVLIFEEILDKSQEL